MFPKTNQLINILAIINPNHPYFTLFPTLTHKITFLLHPDVNPQNLEIKPLKTLLTATEKHP